MNTSSTLQKTPLGTTKSSAAWASNWSSPGSKSCEVMFVPLGLSVWSYRKTRFGEEGFRMSTARGAPPLVTGRSPVACAVTARPRAARTPIERLFTGTSFRGPSARTAAGRPVVEAHFLDQDAQEAPDRAHGQADVAPPVMPVTPRGRAPAEPRNAERQRFRASRTPAVSPAAPVRAPREGKADAPARGASRGSTARL